MSLPPSYFDALYEANPDPWGFATRWYEARKRMITTATLPRQRFGRCFEPGCSTGLLSQELAGRCDELLCTDVASAAVAQASERLAGLPHVRVERAALPEEWPAGDWNLIVLSELGYYFDRPVLDRLLCLAIDALTPDGVLVACHWRHPVSDYPLTGDQVHERLAAQDDLARLSRHEEADFLLETFSRHPGRSVAEVAGLVDRPQ